MAPDQNNNRSSGSLSDPHRPSGQARKKAKIQHARQIHAQKPNPSQSDHARLPEFLDVERFINSRSFEIGAMERSMKLARQSSGQRAFQTLPRHLRRRAASHFARRVPTKLRSKARFEMKNDKAKVLSKSVKSKLSLKDHRNKNRTKKLQRRQVHKRWLETHIWHAKRTKMIDIWGFRLAKLPTEKCYRPTYRAARHGSTLHDLSYYSHLSLNGVEQVLIKTLRRICDPMGPDPCSIRYNAGHRAAEVNLFAHKGWPGRFIGPATLIWCPVPLQSGTEAEISTIVQPDMHLSAEGRIDLPMDAEPLGIRLSRTVLLQIHPSIKPQVIEAVKLASNARVAVEDLRELGCLEFGGPRCTEMMGRVLRGVEEEDEKCEVANWLSAGLKPNVIPMGMIIGITVDDPRLYFPPKKRDSSNDLASLEAQVIQPDLRLARCESFWDPTKRNRKIRFKKIQLDRRRAALEIPGTELVKGENDDRISVLLVRSGIGWKMILPLHWTQAFFHSFIFSSARLVCLDQRAQITFETGQSAFPRDFPTLRPAVELAERDGSEEASYWARKPPAKRVNYQLMDTKAGGGGDPFIPDWKVVIGQKGIQRNKRAEVLTESGAAEVLEPDTVKDNLTKAPESHSAESPGQPWLLVGPLVGVIMQKVMKLAEAGATGSRSVEMLIRVVPQLIGGVVDKVREMAGEKNSITSETGTSMACDWDSALVRVKMMPIGGQGRSGVVENLARLYWSKEDLTCQAVDKDNSKKLQPNAELIGLITTGNYSLTKASSMGLGAISLKKLTEMIIHRAANTPYQEDGRSSTDGKNLKMEFDISYRNKQNMQHELGRIEVLE